MTSAIQRQTVARQGERFPTEWAPYYGDEPNGGWQIQPSEDVRPEGRAPVSPIEEIGHPALRRVMIGKRDGAS
jgi:hypothetical protein